MSRKGSDILTSNQSVGAALLHGAGEWHVRKHGNGKGRRRTWRKLHLCVDETSKDIVAVDLTTSAVHDSPHLPAVLVSSDVGQLSGDRAYDSGTCSQSRPFRRDATPGSAEQRAKDPPPFRVERDAVLRRIRDEGRHPWRTSSGATRPSLAENAVSRFKALVGIKLAARDLGRQCVEALVKSQVLNRMAALGMPRSERLPVG